MMDIDLLLRNVRIAACDDDTCGVSAPAYVAIAQGRIARTGPMSALDVGLHARAEIDGEGALLTPGLIDCHTHLVYAGDRAREFELRLQGASYEDIARAGGGIRSTVQHTRAADDATLYSQSARRLRELTRHGVTTVEIKSGYGLSPDAELKCLRVARELGRRHAVTVRTTLLSAHALPPEFDGHPDAYIDQIVETILPEAARLGLADAVDGFCDTIGFSAAQTRRVFDAARAHRLPVKLHAEQLSNQHGAALAAEFGALSADHLEHSSEASVRAMAAAGTVAVLLPGAFHVLRETRLPPLDLLRAHGVPMAVATDCNPGTSPLLSLRLAMAMACTHFRLTPEEALRGATRHAARALGLHDRGVLVAGARADFAQWRVGHPSELCYWLGGELLQRLVVGGQVRVRRRDA